MKRVDVPLYSELPVETILILNLWNSTMVSDIEELRTCQETLGKKLRQGGFSIERMISGKPQQSCITWDMKIRGFSVLLENFIRYSGQWWQEIDINIL